MIFCCHEHNIHDNGFRICTECGLQTKFIETHILAFNARLCPPTKPYRRENRLKRLYSQVFGFTKIKCSILEAINLAVVGIATKPIVSTIRAVKSFIAARFPHLKRKICSIYRQSGFTFPTNPEYMNIKHMFNTVDTCEIQSFNYLLYYIIYFTNQTVFRVYRQFIKPQTKRLSRKNDSKFILFLDTVEPLRRFIPIIGFNKIPHYYE